jgi:exopolysaccharide biosynthesis polyprenyl glycosylphosphotransferase
MQESRQIERTFLLLDVLVLMVSLVLARELREALLPLLPGLRTEVPFESYGLVLALFVPAWVLCAAHFGLHRVPLVLGPYLGIFRALLRTQLWGGVAIALLLVGLQVVVNRSLIAAFLAVSTLLLLLSKSLQRLAAMSRREQEVALLLGPAEPERVHEIQNLRGRTVEVLEEATPEALGARLHRGGIHEVVIPPGWPREEVHALVQTAEEVGAPVLVGIERLDLDLARPRAVALGQTLYHAYETVHPDRVALFVKALFDRLAALAACVLLSPVLALIAAAIKLDSRGPILFAQERGGLNGRPFRMYKFRTMRDGAEKERDGLLEKNEMHGPVFKIRQDPRVTRVGRWLRRTSLDELPQLFNVLLGQMSLVGPRPLPLVETSQLHGSQRRRMSMAPGLTCLWQVSGRNQIGFDQWMALDLQYIDQWSLWLDFTILLKTVPVVLTGRGAS